MAEDPVDPVDPVDLLIDTLAYLTASEMVKKRVVNRIWSKNHRKETNDIIQRKSSEMIQWYPMILQELNIETAIFKTDVETLFFWVTAGSSQELYLPQRCLHFASEHPGKMVWFHLSGHALHLGMWSNPYPYY